MYPQKKNTHVHHQKPSQIRLLFHQFSDVFSSFGNVLEYFLTFTKKFFRYVLIIIIHLHRTEPLAVFKKSQVLARFCPPDLASNFGLKEVPVPPSGSDLSDHGQISDIFAKNGQI